MKKQTIRVCLPLYALIGVFAAGSAHGAITVLQHYTFNDNSIPAGLTVQAGTASFSGGQLVLDGSTWLAGPSGVTTGDNFGFETIVTASSFDAFDFPGSLTPASTANQGVSLLAQGSWQGLVQGVSAFGSLANSTGTEFRLAFVRDGGTNRFYVNGTEIATNGSVPLALTPQLNVGANPFDAPNGIFNGMVNEVRTFEFTAGNFAASDLLIGPTVPEPSAVLLGFAGLALILRRRK